MSERPDPTRPFALAPNSQRLAVLASYDILDTPPEQGFDDLVQLARAICQAPVALISLVAADRQWFKANAGFPHCETDLERSVCKFVLDEPDLLVIPDLTDDPRTAANPLVTGEPFIRFYAGAPLRSAEGDVLGSLCVLDYHPRPDGLTPVQADALQSLARQAMIQLESRRALLERDMVLATQNAELRHERRLEALAEASAALQTSDDPTGLVIELLQTEAAGLGFDQSYTYDLAPDGRHLQLTHAIGVTEAQQAPLRYISTGVPLCGIVAETGRPLILTHLQASREPRYQAGRDAGLEAFAAYPILRQGQLSGVISFGSTRQHAFEAEALHFFVTIARFLSIGRERLATERELQRTVGKLEAVAQSLQQAQEAGGVGLFTVLIRKDVIYPTPEFCRLYGLPVAESYPATTVEAQVLPEDRGPMSTAASRQRGELTPEVEYRVRHPATGAVRWIARTGRIETDAEGRPWQFTGTARDITDARTIRQALAASEERLTLAFEASGSLGWYDWDIPNDLVRSSDSFARIFGVAPERAEKGAPIAEFFAGIHPGDLARVSHEITAALLGRPDFDTEYRLLAKDGTVTWVHALGRITYDAANQPSRFTGIATDVTDTRQANQRQAAMLALGDRLRDLTEVEAITLAAGETLGTTLDMMLVGYGQIDASAETITIVRDWTSGGAASLAGTLRFRDYGSYIEELKRGDTVVIRDARSDPRTAAFASALEERSVRSFVNVPIIERGEFSGLLYVGTAKAHDWSAGELAFIREVADRVSLATARVRAEDQQELLNRELSHRLKNILAMVQAIATQTLRNASDFTVAREALASRLIALGKAHDILMSGTGERADLMAVVQGALAIHDDAGNTRFRIDGPPVVCAASPALSVALMMHELATNAAKYGALSTPQGFVAVSWVIEGPADRPELTLRWQEQGGPPVTPPARQGFGSKLIVRGLAGSVGGVAKLDYPPEGVTCSLTAPLAGFRSEA